MANLVSVNPEATIWFVPAAATQAEDVVFEIAGLASGSAYMSDQHDFGTGAHSRLYEWRAFVQHATDPVLGDVVDIYLKTAGSSASATAHPDSDEGTTDGAYATNKLVNLHYLGAIIVDETTAFVEMVASGTVEISARAVQVVFHNASADGFGTSDNLTGFMLTPVPDEIQ